MCIPPTYLCRWLSHRKPPELPRGFLAWVRPLMSIPEEKILQLAGLDGYMLLRYIRLCLKVRGRIHSVACRETSARNYA